MKELTEIQQKVLVVMSSGDSDFYFNHDWILGGGYSNLNLGLEYKELSKEMKVLRELGYVEYSKGLMNDDGDMGGSGNHLIYNKRNEVVEFGEAKGWL